MIANLHPYPSHKDSGVVWLGDVPEHWDVCPLISAAKLKFIKNCPERELLSIYLNLGVVKFSEVKEKRTNPTSNDLTNYQAVDPGDFVLNNQQAWRGSVGVSKYEGIVSPAYIVLSILPSLNPDFANYLFRIKGMIDQYLICSKGVGSIQRNLYWPYLKRVQIILPPLPEQTAIVRFLDFADSRIHRSINAKLKLIKLLEEEKQAIIHQAVTRGLDPDVPLKPSGVEWLGDVPEHWILQRMKTVLIERAVKGYPDEPLLAATQSKGVIRKENYENRTVIAQKDLHLLKLVKTGDFVISLRSFQGGIEYAREQGIISPAYTVLYPINSNSHGYLAWLFKSVPFIENLKLNVTGIREGQNIDYNRLSRSKIPLPPLNEQNSIASYLNEITKNIQFNIESINKEIALLREYRTRLIADVVTGKLDVREAAARLPVEADEVDEQEDGEDNDWNGEEEGEEYPDGIAMETDDNAGEEIGV